MLEYFFQDTIPPDTDFYLRNSEASKYNQLIPHRIEFYEKDQELYHKI